MTERSRAAGLGARSAVMMTAFLTDRFFSFVLIVLITRAWDPARVGQWTQMIALTGAFAAATSLGLFQAHVRFAEESADPTVRQSLQLSIMSLTTLAMGLLTIVVMMARHSVSRWTFGTESEVPLLVALCFLAISDLWFEFVITQFRAMLRTGHMALVIGGKAVVRFVIVALFATRTQVDVATVVSILAALQGAIALSIMAIAFNGFHWVNAGFSPAALLFQRAIKMAGPTIVAGIAAQLFVTAERWFLARTLPSAIPHYNVGLQMASNAMLAYIILGSTLYPMMVKAWQSGEVEHTASLQRDGVTAYALIALPALAILPAISRPVFGIITTRYYEIDGVTMFLFMLGAFGFGMHQIAGYTLYVRERTTELLVLLSVAAVAKVILAALLIPVWGEPAAAVTWGVSGLLLAAVTYVRSRQLLTIKVEWAAYRRGITAAAACGIATALVGAWIPGTNRLGALCVGFVALAAYAIYIWPDLQGVLAFRTAKPVRG